MKEYEGILEWINEYRPNPDGKLYIADVTSAKTTASSYRERTSALSRTICRVGW